MGVAIYVYMLFGGRGSLSMLQLFGGGASYCVGGMACPTDLLVGVAGWGSCCLEEELVHAAAVWGRS